MKYNFYADAGHGWLAVKRKELMDLNIIDKISNYSYQKGDTVYLEEDSDVPVFCDAKKIAWKDLNVVEHFKENQSIRNYQSFRK